MYDYTDTGWGQAGSWEWEGELESWGKFKLNRRPQASDPFSTLQQSIRQFR